MRPLLSVPPRSLRPCTRTLAGVHLFARSASRRDGGARCLCGATPDDHDRLAWRMRERLAESGARLRTLVYQHRATTCWCMGQIERHGIAH